MRSTVVAHSDTGDDDGRSAGPSREVAAELLGQHTAVGESEEPDSRPIRVLLVIDLKLVRGAFTALLSGEAGIEVIAGLGLSECVFPAPLQFQPDVAVLDVDVGGADGLMAALQFHEWLPTCRVVALASAQRPGLVHRALGAHVAGAVDKDGQPSQLATTIRQVAADQRAIDPTLAVAALAAPTNPLTLRELAVLDLAADGTSASLIADELLISPGTVRNHLSRAMSKLGARSRIDAIRIARDVGWL